MSKAIADLMNEHEAILSAIQILERMMAAMEKAAAGEAKDVHDFIGFLKEFADKCHHGKEEGLLFSAMVGAGIPDKGGPIGVMLAEHALGRHLIRDMEGALSTGVDRATLAQAAGGYAALLRSHIQKENMILFPMADRVLSEPQLEKLYEGFEEHEEKVIGHGRHEELHAMLHSLQEKYPAQ
jgi:hemerythrin-like domain-containing protein